jgi:predicted ArsR family transcriptional regulator
MDKLEKRLRAVAALNDPTRRKLYEQAARRPEGISRDEAAKVARISRMLAAFHLDRLVEVGLLKATYRRLSGKQGPRAGRPSKLYQRTDRDVQVTLPERRYELVARLFADAIDQPGESSMVDRVAAAARDFGRRLASGTSRRLRKRSSAQDRRAALEAVLDDYGFEPYEEAEVVRLHNCPFDALARDHRQLVCGANLHLMKGLLNGLEMKEAQAQLDPRPGTCCVAFVPLRRAGAD